MVKDRKRLVGYISLDALDEWAEDFSKWSGEITYPDPQGANLAWQKTIEMVERRPLERIISRENVDRILSGMPWLSSDGQNIILEELFGATDEGEDEKV